MGFGSPPLCLSGAPNSVTSLAPPQSLYQTVKWKGYLYSPTQYSVVQWENEKFNKKIATDHFQETRLSAEDGICEQEQSLLSWNL